MSTNLFQRLENFWEQRAEFRKQALVSLRKREGLLPPTRLNGVFYQRENGDFYPEPPGRETTLDTEMYPNGQGGYTQWAKGTRKGDSLDQAAQHWNSASAPFEILEVAEDGRKLEDELRDLDRDAHGMREAEKVSHGEAGQQAPGFVIDNLSDDAELDQRLQEYLKRGLR